MLFIILVILLGWALAQQMEGDASWVVVATTASLGMSLVGYFRGDTITLAMAGARRVTRDEAPYVVRMVENLAITAGVPTPGVAIINDPTINAFATGRDPKHATVAVTTGAIEQLENEELEGVLAHELSHIKNFDTRYMMLVAVLVGMTVILADFFWRSRWLGVGGRRSRSDSNAGGSILMLLGLLLIIFAPLAARLIQFAVSRRREFLADASGALLTRYPEGLANALRKIERTNTRPMAHVSNATAHLFIANPFGAAAKGMARLFATHPPIAERIHALEHFA